MEVFYAVQVKTGKELIIQKVLSTSVSGFLKDQTVEIVVPTQLSWKRTRQGYKKKISPILSGYILLKCVSLTDNLYHFVKNTPGVCRVLRSHITNAEIQVMTGLINRTIFLSMRAIERSRKQKSNLMQFLSRVINFKKVVKANLKKERSTGYQFRFQPLLI